LARRAAALITWAEAEESKLAKGEPFDHAAYCTATNSLRRVLIDLGLDRVMRDAGAASIEERRRRLEEARAVVERRAPLIVTEPEITPAGASEASP
jgi:hypothetical protein